MRTRRPIRLAEFGADEQGDNQPDEQHDEGHDDSGDPERQQQGGDRDHGDDREQGDDGVEPTAEGVGPARGE
ncbi:hypothetical protein R3751_04665 [Halorubrum distributum]|uniref:hypothetical protein n=1 Tax=Halorubrum distributum TaxID=29283 RepID=UPI0029556374|nr:hypothetical protein [Halorubrum distributum]MDV7349071.1 hypothetical protein [Halorubrum distributum]